MRKFFVFICLWIAGILLYSVKSNAQVWYPHPGRDTAVKGERVQCWGTTAKRQRCKNLINTTVPGKAMKIGNSVYLCPKHLKQSVYYRGI